MDPGPRLTVVCLQDAALERDVDFWVSLCCEFTASEQLSSLVSLLLFLLKLPDDKQDGEAPLPLVHAAPVGRN